MTDARYKQLNDSDDYQLTPDEIALGWHWCNEFDGLLVGPECDELHFCSCWPKEHPVYKTKPDIEPEPIRIDENDF